MLECLFNTRKSIREDSYCLSLARYSFFEIVSLKVYEKSNFIKIVLCEHQNMLIMLKIGFVTLKHVPQYLH